MTEYEKLVEKAKDCGVKYGIYSPQYADAVHKMNDFWLKHHAKKLTFREMIQIKKQKYMTAWKRKKS